MVLLSPLEEVYRQTMSNIGTKNRERAWDEGRMAFGVGRAPAAVAFAGDVCPSLFGVPHGSVKRSQGIQRIPAP